MSKPRNWAMIRRLYVETVTGAGGYINCEEDAVFTAAILRELANELDPAGQGDKRGKPFLDTIKTLIHWDG